MTKEKMPAPWKENYDKPIEYIKKQRSLCQQMFMVKATVFQ